MTVSSEVSRNDYYASGSPATQYDYEFKIYTKTDLKVYVSGDLKTVDEDFSISGVLGEDGGYIIFDLGYVPEEGEPIALLLDLPLTQLTNYTEGDKFPAETHEIGLDRLTKISQSFKETMKKILKIPIWSTLADIVVPIQASSFLKWNSSGTQIVCVPEWESGDPLPSHAEDHEYEGSDEINVEDLPGVLAEDQHVKDPEVLAVAAAKTHGSLHFPNGTDPIGLPKFSAHKNTVNQTAIVTATPTKVTFTTEVYDVGSKYDATNSRWIPGIVGKVHIDTGILWTSMVDGTEMDLRVYVNGTYGKRKVVIGSKDATNHGISISCDIPINTITDYVEIWATQASGDDRIISGTEYDTWFMGHCLP